MCKLISDDHGFVVSIELVLVATIAVIGMIVGITSVRDGILGELGDVAGGIQDLKQGYTVAGIVGHSFKIGGFAFFDYHDFCDTGGSDHGTSSACITISAAPTDEA